MKQLVVGILAHVDSGKTTLSEGLLYQAGSIKKLGRVDNGNSFLDSDFLERERGITIFSKQAVLDLGETSFTLLDTPGHVDFSPEMERTLQVLDYAILVISGTDGIQSHTETLWQLLRKHKIPTFLFVNKMDLAGVQRESLLERLQNRFSAGCVDFSAGQAEGMWEEAVALCEETLLNQVLETGHMTDSAVAAAIAQRKVFPCYFGAALKMTGVEDFLNGMMRYTQSRLWHNTFSAKIFKVARDQQGNRLTYLKVTGGRLKVKDMLHGQTKKREVWSEKVNQIRIYSGAKYQAVEQALPGTVCAVTGLTQSYPGEGLGGESASEAPLLEPVLTYRVELPKGLDAHTALGKLRLLEEEEPQLHTLWNEPLQEIHVQLMGQIQLEVLKRILLERFAMDVSFGQGNILYKETIEAMVEGVGHFEPLRHYAEVHLLLEPGERGSGLCFDSSCREDDLDKNWQRLVLTHLEEKLHRGVLTGSPITDMKITLTAGRAHVKHTEGGDFRQATYRAVRQGLRQAKNILLEPWYAFSLTVPTETVGRALADLQRMNASFDPPEAQGEYSHLVGNVPAVCIQDYQTELIGYTHGKGRLACTLKGYEPCHNTDEVIAAIGYDCDADLENTADSVFCAHGAAVLVKWDQVPASMHLESTLPPAPKEDVAPTHIITQRASDYYSRLAEDKELMAIFERTYGPIRREAHATLRTTRTTAKSEGSPQSAEPPQLVSWGPEYLLVDGYNIIFAWEELSTLARDNLDAARNRLVQILCNYQGFCQCELIVVFDAYKVKGGHGSIEKVYNISVVYTKEAETADMYIEKVTHSLSKKHRVRVATSDGLEQLIILSSGALRVSAKAFLDEVKQVERAMQDFLA